MGVRWAKRRVKWWVKTRVRTRVKGWMRKWKKRRMRKMFVVVCDRGGHDDMRI